MSNLSKLEFVALDISGKNYLSWVLDAEIHLVAKALGNTIIQENETSGQDKAKAMIFLRHHLDEGLKTEYLTLKDPFELWSSLKERYDHLNAMILPRARYEWQQYREKGLKKYSELISCLLVVEKHNTLLMKNHEARPNGSAPFSEVNMVVATQKSERRQNHYRGRGRGRGHSRGRGQGHGRG
ncbi:uncharacterized protein [Nicotiana tomentosiformis]|uniref:uncharacterized protein n=1 Tax=Nicotiana tomentosiformis TaxID=4098 RepID=UPI00051C7970|nr:uncharacterized protein LOC104120663 [Nicotiana tomentosiformis]